MIPIAAWHVMTISCLAVLKSVYGRVRPGRMQGLLKAEFMETSSWQQLPDDRPVAISTTIRALNFGFFTGIYYNQDPPSRNFRPRGPWAVRYCGQLTSRHTGRHQLSLAGTGRFRLLVRGQCLIDAVGALDSISLRRESMFLFCATVHHLARNVSSLYDQETARAWRWGDFSGIWERSTARSWSFRVVRAWKSASCGLPDPSGLRGSTSVFGRSHGPPKRSCRPKQ